MAVNTQEALAQRLANLEKLASQILKEISEIKALMAPQTESQVEGPNSCQSKTCCIDTYEDFKEAAVEIIEDLLPEVKGLLIPTFRVREAFWERFGEDTFSPRQFSDWMLQLVQDEIVTFSDTPAGPEIGAEEKMNSHIRGIGHKFYLQYRRK